MVSVRWLVVLPGERVGDSEIFGPFHTERAARRAADRWNARNGAADAVVVPLRPAADLRDAR